MARASVFVLLFGVVAFAGCYYDKSEPEMGSAAAPNYISNVVALELVSQPVKFKFSEAVDVVSDDTAADTTGPGCGGVDCTTTGFICHPTADVCVRCYVDAEEVDVNCTDGQFCLEDEDPTLNQCAD